MAVELTGDDTTFQSTAQGGTQSYTIPSDATAVIVIANGTFTSSTANELDELNWDAGGTMDFDLIVKLVGTGNQNDLAAYVITDADVDWPGTGAQTLSFNMTSAFLQGQTYVIQAIKGGNTSTAGRVRDEDSASNAAQTWNASLTGVVSGDMTFIARADYSADVGSHTVGTATEFHNIDNEGVTSVAAFEAGQSAPTVTAIADSGDDGNIAFAMAEAADDIAHVAALAESFANAVQRRRIKITNF